MENHIYEEESNECTQEMILELERREKAIKEKEKNNKRKRVKEVSFSSKRIQESEKELMQLNLESQSSTWTSKLGQSGNH